MKMKKKVNNNSKEKPKNYIKFIFNKMNKNKNLFFFGGIYFHPPSQNTFIFQLNVYTFTNKFKKKKKKEGKKTSILLFVKKEEQNKIMVKSKIFIITI